MKWIFLCLILFTSCSRTFTQSETRHTASFNNDWKFFLGDTTGAQNPTFNDQGWRTLNLPHDWSIEGKFD